MQKKYAVILCLITLVLSIGFGALAGYLAANSCVLSAQMQKVKAGTDSSEKGLHSSEVTPEVTPDVTPTVSMDQEYTIADIAKKCTKSVVSITIEDTTQGYTGGSAYKDTVTGHGTGVIIRENGFIVTCYHVVEGAEKITVTMDDQTEYTAEMVGYDDRFDLAVIRVDAVDLPAVALGNSDTMDSGEEIVVIGNPLGEFGFSVTAGILSAPARELTVDETPLRLMQMDAAVNPGNSGGALLNMQGQLIGIVNAKISASGIEGIAFALPWNSIQGKVESIISDGNTGKKAVLGVSTKTSVCYIDDEKVACVEIVDVRPGSAAEKAGLKSGDFLLSADGKTLKNNDDLSITIKYHAPGDRLIFKVYRDYKEIEIVVTLGES